MSGIESARTKAYSNAVLMQVQQTESRLVKAVTMGTYTGSAAKVVEQIAPVTPFKRTTRHADTPIADPEHTQRWVHPTHYEYAALIDHQDQLETIGRMTDPYTKNAAATLKRAQDDEIIQAFFGAARTGEKGDALTAFPTSQSVAIDTGATTDTGLNVAKLRFARRLLRKAEVDLENDEIYIALTAEQEDDLMKEWEVVSRDFNEGAPVLTEGRVTKFMGFTFIHTERLSLEGSNRLIPVWAKSGMHLAMWDGVQGRVDERADKSYATQVYARGTFGATRLEEKKVVQIVCKEGA